MKSFFRIIGAVAVLAAAIAGAGSLYSWSSGEYLSATQLNSNFSHIHNNMVGGHGARLVDADVSGSANISRSKLSGYGALPVAYAKVGSGTTACASTPCTVADGYGISGVTRAGAGSYTATFTTSMGDTEYGLLVLSHTDAVYCRANVSSATTATINCGTTLTVSASATDAYFTIVAFDAT